MTAIDLRPVQTHAEFAAVEAVQRAVWPGSETDVVPRHLLSTAAANGGLVIGAFAGDELVGFVFGFLGTDSAEGGRPALTQLKHCSHMLGVRPEYRDQDIGYRLKLAQRDFVLGQGVRLVTWTYDPLESRNARLNIARLGAVCRTYKRDVYGAMADELNAGLPSDRFQVDWWVTSARVRERLLGQRAQLVLDSFLSAGSEILNPTQAAPDDGLPRPPRRVAEPTSTFALIEIPRDFQTLKTQDQDLAQEWRAHTRALFEAAFAQGYLVTDFFTEVWEGRLRSFYALSYGDVRTE